MIGHSVYIDTTAIVDPGAEIGSMTKVWHFSHISASARIGESCILGQNVFVGNGVVIGNGVKVQNNVSVYEGVSLEDDVFVGPSVVFTNVRNPRSFIERKDEFMGTLVSKGASLGANSTILCGVRIGRYAMVGAGALIVADVPDHAVVVGNPSRQIGWVSEAGYKLELNNDGKAYCKEERCWYVKEFTGLAKMPMQ